MAEPMNISENNNNNQSMESHHSQRFEDETGYLTPSTKLQQYSTTFFPEENEQEEHNFNSNNFQIQSSQEKSVCFFFVLF